MAAIVALPAVSTAPSMAEGTTGVKPAGAGEKAPTARPEAWSLGHMVGQETVARLDVERGWGSGVRACGGGLVAVTVKAGMDVSDVGCDAAAVVAVAGVEPQGQQGASDVLCVAEVEGVC